MRYKPIQKTLAILFVLSLALPPLIRADMFAPGGEVALGEGDFSPIGGFSSTDEVSLESGSRPPSRLTRQDYQNLYERANDVLQAAQNYRRSELQYTLNYSVTTIAQLEQNYMDKSGGELYYRFCANYGAVDEQGYCPEGDPLWKDPRDIRNNLIQARNAFATLSVADPSNMPITGTLTARQVGRAGVLEATREIAQIHILFGGEFLIDAQDTRFSGADSVVGADTLVEEEIRQLDLARQHFALAMDVLVEAFVMDIGGPYGTYIGDYFGPAEFELYAIASERLAFTLNELAFHYRQFGTGTITFVDNSTKEINGDKTAIALYTEALSNQYIQALGLAQEATERGLDFYEHGGYTILDSVTRIHEGARAIQEGINPFGYRDDYVPRETFANLMETARARQDDAADLETEALTYRRQFDMDATTVLEAAQNLQDEYAAELVDLCGGSGTQPEDFVPCDGGLIEQNYYDMAAASRKMSLAWKRVNDIAERIRIEQERADQTINVILGGGQEISAIELAEGKLRAIQTTSTIVDATTTTSAWGFDQEVRGYLEVWIGGSRSVGLSLSGPSVSIESGGQKAGIELAAACIGEYRHERSHTHAIETTINLNELEIGEYESMRALSIAEGDAEIEGVESDAVIKNLLLDQSERLIEWEITVEEYNKLSAEHNHLVEKYYNLLNRWEGAERVTVEGYLNNPGYRFLREMKTLQAAREQARAARYAYLAAKAAEYDFLTPVPFLSDIYRARMAGEVLAFLNNLQDWYNTQASPEPYVQKLYNISLARDVAGLTDAALDPTGTLTETALTELRFERFQEFLQGHVVDLTIKEAGQEKEKPFLSVPFETSLSTQLTYGGFYSSDDWNIRIVGLNEPEAVCSSPDECHGVSVDILTRQTWSSPTDPSIRLRHGGANTLQNSGGSLVEYAPGPILLFSEYGEIPLELGLRDTSAVASVGASVNGVGGGYTPQLFNLSVSASSWQLRIDLEANNLLDIAQIEDIVITMDTSAHTRARAMAQNESEMIPAQTSPQLKVAPMETFDALSPTGIFDNVEDVTAELCCTILIPPPEACGDAGIWDDLGATRSPALSGFQNRTQLDALSTVSKAEATAVISGTFRGTVAITEPVRLGVLDIAFELEDVGGVLSGTLILTDTLAFTTTGPLPTLHGSVSGDLFTLTSEPFHVTVSGREVQRQFTIVGQAMEEHGRLEGIYTEVITGFVPEPITVVAMFVASGPVRHQDLLALTPSSLHLEAASDAVDIADSTVVSATIYNGLGRILTETQRITFTAKSGTVTPQAVTTVNGVAVATFTAGDVEGHASITATSPSGWFVDTVEIVIGQSITVYLPLVLRQD